MKIQIFDGMSVDLSSFLKTWFFIYRDFFHWRIYYKKDEAKLGIFQQDRFERIYDHQIKHYNMERWWSVTTPVAWSTTTKSRWKADRLFKANSTGTSNTQRKWKSAEEKFCLAGWSLSPHWSPQRRLSPAKPELWNVRITEDMSPNLISGIAVLKTATIRQEKKHFLQWWLILPSRNSHRLSYLIRNFIFLM